MTLTSLAPNLLVFQCKEGVLRSVQFCSGLLPNGTYTLDHIC